MDININAFKEPRGVMRILHFIFSICAFATITGYTGYVYFKCQSNPNTKDLPFDYPFDVKYINANIYANCNVSIIANFSSDAKFFVATGVLAMLYSIAISIIYLKFDDLYRSNTQIPLIDFIFTVIFGVLWLSSSAAWANGLSGLKSVTSSDYITNCMNKCVVTTSNFTKLNISVIFGFLNFFIWAADLWFLYKETAWFQGNQQQSANGV